METYERQKDDGDEEGRLNANSHPVIDRGFPQHPFRPRCHHAGARHNLPVLQHPHHCRAEFISCADFHRPVNRTELSMASPIQPEGYTMIFGIASIFSLIYYVFTGYEIAFVSWVLSLLLMLVCL